MLPKVEQSSIILGCAFVPEHTASIPSASLSYWWKCGTSDTKEVVCVYVCVCAHVKLYQARQNSLVRGRLH